MLRFFQKRLNLDISGTISRAMIEQGKELRTRWRDLTIGHDRQIDKVEIVLVGKYTSLHDSYTSVVKSLEHAALRCHRKLELKWVESSDLEHAAESENPSNTTKLGRLSARPRVSLFPVVSVREVPRV